MKVVGRVGFWERVRDVSDFVLVYALCVLFSHSPHVPHTLSTNTARLLFVCSFPFSTSTSSHPHPRTHTESSKHPHCAHRAVSHIV
jgi:hypothetical protein